MGRPIGDQEEDRISTKHKVSMVKMTEDHFENLSTQKWLEGKHHVYGELLAFLKTKAAAAFSEGKDALAKQLRDDIPRLIAPFFAELEKNADRHEKDFPYELIEFNE